MRNILLSVLVALATFAADLHAEPARVSGLDLEGFDRSVRPQDDLYRFAGGNWLARTEIPADRSSYGTFSKLEDDAKDALRALVEAAAATRNAAPGSDTQKVGDLYASFTDTARIESRGLRSLDGELAAIAALRSTRDVYGYMGRAQRLGIGAPVRAFVGQDGRDATRYLVALNQAGLSMPDRDYYLVDEPRNLKTRAALAAYIEKLLTLAGRKDGAAAAQRIIALEKRIAEKHWTRVENRNPVKTYNKVTLAAAAELAPGFDFTTFFAANGPQAAAITEFNVRQPTYVRALAEIVRDTSVEDWRAYFSYRLLDAYSPYLPKKFDDAHFEFRLAELRGIKEPAPRWRRGVELIDERVGEIAGRMYVERNFPPEARTRIRELVANLRQAFDLSIDSLDWMSAATKAEAKRKLASFTVKVGYPDQWRDYGKLVIARDDLVGNLLRSAAFEHERGLDKLGKPIDRTEWMMTPQTVNAYYSPPMNEIVFPAAILRKPFFDPAADDAVNYGGIGAVIGHEISHGFDDQGRQYDGGGNLRDWWTFDDNVRFRERAGKLAAQYDGFKPIDGKSVNGQLTLGENIGDLSGLAMAYRAYQLSLAGKPAPVIDGFTGPQRFFLGWAQIWQRKYRDDELRLRLVTDPHSPSEYRCNGVVANIAEFYEAFGVKEGDRLYRPPAERVRIW